MKKSILFIACIAGLSPCFAQGGWTKIASPSPVATFTSNGAYKGAAWVDINNDGWIDLFAMPNYVFLNNGSGNFTQLTTSIDPAPLQNPGGCSWGDINNDGFIDLITAQNPSEIYINNGDTTFQNVSSSISGLSGFASWGCALADVNNDNRLDLLYAQAYGFHGAATPYPCKLFFQDPANFTFNPVSGYVFTDSLKPYTVPYFDDYDMDGDMDLFIATGPGGSPGPDYCYRNMKMETGHDTLYPMTAEPWTGQLQDGQCYNTIDSDNDGDLDACLTNYGGASSRFYVNTMVDSILICWPSGIKECYTNVAAAQFVTYMEGGGMPVGTQENASLRDGITVYPNPSHTEAQVSFPGLKGSYTLKLYDTAASLLYSDQVEDASYSIPLRNLKPGPYFIFVNYGGEHILKKLIVTP